MGARVKAILANLVHHSRPKGTETDQSSVSVQRAAAQRPDWFAAIYRAIDAALAGGDRNVPPGTLATLYRALDGLREIGGCEAHVSRGSAMVVTLHRSQAMLRHGNDRDEMVPLRHDLKAMQRDWLMTTRPDRHSAFWLLVFPSCRT